jgi:hypothetical protein
MRKVLKNIPLNFGFCLLLVILAGCHVNYTQPAGPVAQLTPEQQNFDAYWQASLEVLRKYNFETDPARGALRSRRDGKIVSMPLVGKHWFEFWRHDAATWYDYKESSVQTIYRTARVSIAPSAQGSGMFQAQATVNTSRSDRVTRNSQSVGDAYNMFVVPGSSITDNNLMKNILPEDEIQRQEMRRGIVDLGQDDAFSARLTAEINDLAGLKIASGK